ncbi:Ig-like domain-containing protein, partial [Bradyrhizobium sp. Cp5.3]|uniref:Ig-like domain-containing protein n=1 Tax=Bradyrhizobium sp. Cp5.3 TaxID=443598 RepID=UPI000557F42F
MAAKTTNGSAIALKTTLSGLEIDGGNGADVITADILFQGADDPTKGYTYTIVGGNGDDIVWGSSRNETIWGDSNGNSSTSDNGADQLHGGGGDDQIQGGNGDDKIWGDDGNDTLFGDNGADSLTGGLGADVLTGGKGGDKFIYLLTTDSTANANGSWNPNTGDWIKDFNHSEGDKLDFTGFNDITGSGHPDKLTWDDSGTGGRYKIWTSNGFVYADTNGDSTADLAIKVTGTVGANDFLGINHAPVAVSDTGTTDEDHSVVLNPLANDTDSDGDALSITTVSIAPGHGTATITDSGHTITYDPTSAYQYLAAGESVQVTINYTISDGHGGTANAVEIVTVNGVDDVPIAVADIGSMG